MQIYKTIIQKGMKWQELVESKNVLSSSTYNVGLNIFKLYNVWV